jgi:hypothetical protein
MKSVLKRKKISVGKTPSWLKRFLLVLLFASTVAGFIFSTTRARHSAIKIPAFFNKIPSFFNKPVSLKKAGEFGDFVVFRDKSGLTEIEIVCHGMGVGKDGLSRAVVDGTIVAPGAIIRGMKIVEINASNILVECSGKSLRLEPGERVAPVVQTNGSPQPDRQIKPSVPF